MLNRKTHPGMGAATSRRGCDVVAVIVVSLTGLMACDLAVQPSTPLQPRSGPFIISSPVLVPARPSTEQTPPVSSSEIVFVSLPPDSIPDGITATISNIHKASAVSVPLLDGGFDPVSLIGSAGDTITVSVIVSGSSMPVANVFTVPANAKPTVLRVTPPPHKRDVPLNTIIVIVFSEPMDSASVAGSMLLRQGGAVIPGVVTLPAAGGKFLKAVFVPTGPLSPVTNYQLEVSTAAQSESGDPLVGSLHLSFTTGLVPSAVTGVIVVPSPFQILVGGHQVMSATAFDSAGNALAVPRSWTSSANGVATVSAAGDLLARSPGVSLIRATCGGAFTDASVTVVPVPVGLIFRSVITTGYTTCGLSLGGAMYCWGGNSYGEVGASSATGPQSCVIDGVAYPCSTTPVAVPAGLAFTGMASGGTTNCGLTANVDVYCWGANFHSQLGSLSSMLWESYVPVAVDHGVRFVQVSVGATHTCGVTGSGVAYCWGYNMFGQLGNSTESANDEPVPQRVAGGLAFTMVSTGSEHACGLTTNGTAYCWGSNRLKLLGYATSLASPPCIAQEPGDTTWTCSPVPVPVSGGLLFATLSAAQDHTCGVTTTGTTYCWGNNAFGQLGNGSNTGPDQCALLYYSPFSCSYGPIAVVGGHTFVAVSASRQFTCGLTVAGAAYCWGSNRNGSLGTGSATGPEQCIGYFGEAFGCSSTPMPVAGGLTFASISAGCGITTVGITYCWGDNSVGQLGDGTTMSSSVPVKVALQP